MTVIKNKSHNEMMNNLSLFCQNSLDFPVADIKVLSAGSTAAAHLWWRARIDEGSLYHSIYKAYTACTSARNDVILVTPESHAWKGDTNAGGEALTWSKESTHLIGMNPTSKGAYGRARFGHSGFTMANFMTVSGANNVFKNVRWMHGASTGGASDTTCLTVTGAGNVFDGVNFGGPMDATQAASANYVGVYINGGTSNYFRDCMFGTNNAVDRNGASCMLKLAGAGGLNIFENCIFRSHSTANAYFINWGNTEQAGVGAIFLNCQFINVKAAAEADMTLAILANSQHANDYLYFDNRCTFVGVTDVIAAASEGKVLVGGQTYTAAITSNLLASTIDHTA